jgi:hypothetical protein|tara:strand:+ start:2570 stop:4024 length:1455 start_codon:yes stop_codon:yes gene_type:complete
MKNIFNVSDDEKNRIRGLHLTESDNKKLSSRLNEQEDMDTSPRQEPLGPTDDKAAPDFGVAEPQKSVKASGSSPCPPTNGQSPYYQNYPEFCYEQIPGSQIYYHQQPGMTYHNHPDGHCCHNGPSSFRCHPVQGCVNINQQGGQFLTMQDCLNSGCQPQGTTHYCVNCQNQTMATYNTSNAQGCPPGYLDVGPNVPQQGPCVDCTSGPGSCQAVGWNGPYNTMQQCQQQCAAPTNHECVNNSCMPDPNGQFPTLLDCQNSGCGQPTSTTYDCTDWTDPSGCQPVQGNGGQFPSLDDCLASPCQCDQHILSWGFYTNNPNNPQGNWGSSSHDGPSNQNAIANQLANVQNSNGYQSGIVGNIHYQKMKCREKAALWWQQNQGGASCSSFCSTWTNAVDGSNQYGCVTNGWINTMNNFMNNSSNWPGQGCQWLNNALSNAVTGQANFQPGQPGYCKYQGKIDFINNFKATGQSAYVPGQASFPLPCV